MHKTLSILIISVIAIILPLQGQDYPASSIPEELKKEANTVIRNSTQSFIQTDTNNGLYTVNEVITILNSKGRHNAHFYISTDKFVELAKFSGILRDATGKVIKKIKKGDLVYSSLEFDSFTSGSYNVSYECQSPSYPFTIEYNYEVKYKGGILGYPSFIPITRSNISVEKASYNLEVPESVKVRLYANYSPKIENISSNGKNTYRLSETNLPAIINETWMPDAYNLVKITNFAPSDFCYDSHCGNMDNWKNYGLWVNQLLTSRDNLPADLVTKLKEMISSAKDEKEKVKYIYQYLQKNTRYISVQLGIGGYQPETAINVAKTKMGDCKGLTNLMKAMLKAVDINSNYCVISHGDTHKKFYDNFPSFKQANHVILLVPLQNDSIWLECTNSNIPFGFIHSGIADHDVLVISDKGGELCHIPAYDNDNFVCTTEMTINIEESGKATGELNIEESMDIAVGASLLKEQSRENQIKYLTNEIRLPKIQFGNVEITYTPSEKPKTKLSSSYEASDVVNKTGSRLFMRSYPLKKGSFRKFGSGERIHDVEIPQMYIHSDKIKYILPEGYSAESLPKDINIDNEFGKFSRKLTTEGNIVNSELFIELKAGKYDKSKYDEIKEFLQNIDSALSSRLVFKKD